MKIYKYIARRLENNNLSLEDIFWWKKERQMKKWIEELINNGFDIKIEKLDEILLKSFYNNLYSVEISKKANPRVHNLIDWYWKKTEVKDRLFLACIIKDDILVWWCIFEYTENMEKLKISYKASDNLLIHWFWLWSYIDYIIFKDALHNWVKLLSRGKDLNAYWLLWSNPGLTIQKLMTKFLPYISINDEITEIDEKKIDKETLIFSNPDWKGKFCEASFWTPNVEEIEKKFGLIRKAWIKLNIYKI